MQDVAGGVVTVRPLGKAHPSKRVVTWNGPFSLAPVTQMSCPPISAATQPGARAGWMGAGGDDASNVTPLTFKVTSPWESPRR